MKRGSDITNEFDYLSYTLRIEKGILYRIQYFLNIVSFITFGRTCKPINVWVREYLDIKEKTIKTESLTRINTFLSQSLILNEVTSIVREFNASIYDDFVLFNILNLGDVEPVIDILISDIYTVKEIRKYLRNLFAMAIKFTVFVGGTKNLTYLHCELLSEKEDEEMRKMSIMHLFFEDKKSIRLRFRFVTPEVLQNYRLFSISDYTHNVYTDLKEIYINNIWSYIDTYEIVEKE